jgi:hypothetical protein
MGPDEKRELLSVLFEEEMLVDGKREEVSVPVEVKKRFEW